MKLKFKQDWFRPVSRLLEGLVMKLGFVAMVENKRKIDVTLKFNYIHMTFTFMNSKF